MESVTSLALYVPCFPSTCFKSCNCRYILTTAENVAITKVGKHKHTQMYVSKIEKITDQMPIPIVLDYYNLQMLMRFSGVENVCNPFVHLVQYQQKVNSSLCRKFGHKLDNHVGQLQMLHFEKRFQFVLTQVTIWYCINVAYYSGAIFEDFRLFVFSIWSPLT